MRREGPSRAPNSAPKRDGVEGSPVTPAPHASTHKMHKMHSEASWH